MLNASFLLLRISNDERVLYNDTETLMVRLLSYLLGSCVANVLHTAWISNDDRVLYNDTETVTQIKATKSFTRFICDTGSTYCLNQQ